MDDLAQFPVGRLKDNRLQGLLREIAEAMSREESPEILRTLGQSLKMLGDLARSRSYERQKGTRHW